ncbi:TPA: helix-turn-helix transcriptional regulator [Klebsiella variicola subsp. variicola]
MSKEQSVAIEDNKYHRKNEHIDNSNFCSYLWLCELFVVDTCHYGREGFRSALNKYFYNSGHIKVKVFETLNIPLQGRPVGIMKHKVEIRCLVIRLPENRTEALQMLLQLGSFPTGHFSRMVIMSTIEPTIIRSLLQNVGMSTLVYFADSRLRPEVLCKIVLPEQSNSMTTMNQYEVLRCKSHLKFTYNERQVLLGRLQGISVKEQALVTGKSVKTIYTQQANAFRKLNVRNIHTLFKRLSSDKQRAVYDAQYNQRRFGEYDY